MMQTVSHYGNRWPRLFVVVLAGLLVAVACSDNDDPPSESDAGHTRGADEPFDADGSVSLADFATSSDLVIRGEVVGTTAGRRIEEEPGSFLEYERVTIRIVDHYLSHGSESEPGEVVLEQSVRSGGSPVALAGLEPLSEGQEAILFLTLVPPDMNEPGDVTYVITEGVGRFDIGNDGSLDGPDIDGPIVPEIEALGLTRLETHLNGLDSDAGA